MIMKVRRAAPHEPTRRARRLPEPYKLTRETAALEPTPHNRGSRADPRNCGFRAIQANCGPEPYTQRRKPRLPEPTPRNRGIDAYEPAAVRRHSTGPQPSDAAGVIRGGD